MNSVQRGSFLTLHYRLAGPDDADIINTFTDKPATLSMGTGQLAPAMEARLMGLAEGTHTRFELGPDEAFGQRNPELMQRVKRSVLARLRDPKKNPKDHFDLGDVVHFPTPDGQGTYSGVVRELGEDDLLFDFNHPLAGVPLTFEVRLIGVL
ncbi:MAG TPA: FKBP-type peptidyl-prolyl cis-trans isomerase [Gemmatimonadales bacterium]|nr:FKBP-type peptidyl-prolyl cis-trans isomerase [Gemmatimonadales bacterium]